MLKPPLAIPLNLVLETLAGDLGFFPLEYGAYPPYSDSYNKQPKYSEFYRVMRETPTTPIRALPLGRIL